MKPALLAIPVVLLIGWLDYVTGPEIGLSLLYLIPIAITAWKGQGIAASIVAAIAAACWIAADYLAGRALALSLWNGFTRIVIYEAAAFLVDRIRIDREKLQEMNTRLAAALQDESELARTDAVTGLANSRAFHEQLAQELARAERDERSITLLYLDLDGFKAVNDTYGHEAGDAVLRRVADALRQSVRSGDVVARLGGDEFVALLWGSGIAAASEVGRRISERVETIALAYPDASFGISIGIAQAHGGGGTAADLLRRADESMYEQKVAQRQTGR
jgi:diguanylate cyclase (GGDEF)-like protein